MSIAERPETKFTGDDWMRYSTYHWVPEPGADGDPERTHVWATVGGEVHYLGTVASIEGGTINPEHRDLPLTITPEWLAQYAR